MEWVTYMSDNFYKFNHECDKMPTEVALCQLNNSYTSQFTFLNHVFGVGKTTTTLYGFEYCPYCGKKLTDQNRIFNA